MGAVVGIDLGTTNTVVAAMRDGAPIAIRDETGSSLIPSIVSFLPSGAVMVGSAALERRADDTKNTVFSVKRLIGRPWDSPEVRQARSRFSFELKEGPGRATFVVARNETFTLPEISAFVLRKAKSIAEIELGETVDRTVVTVPANFNDLQRAATKVAGRVAGLDVMRILNEPTAAALAYGYHQGNSERIAVFDFGGGTFDITLLSLTQNVFEVLATAGNTFLGGDDLDWAIADRIADEFSARLGLEIRNAPAALEYLRAAGEAIKIQLATATQAEIEVDLTRVVESAHSTLSFAMSRAEFEQLAIPVIDRAFDVCREALGIAAIDVGDIDHVLAVGGCTKIPLVRARAAEFFRRNLDAHLDPHEVVAIGAALQAHALTTANSAQVEIPPVPIVQKAAEVQEARDDWRRKTHPFGRLGTTNVGQGQLQSGQVDGIQVPKPEGVPSRPIPNTQNIGSRGRQNTAMGIGSNGFAPLVDPDAMSPEVVVIKNDAESSPRGGEQRAVDPLDAESFLPVVTALGSPRHRAQVFRAEEFATKQTDLSEPDDEEATIVRAPSGSVPDSEIDLPEVALSAPTAPRATVQATVPTSASAQLVNRSAPPADMTLPAVTAKRSKVDGHGAASASELPKNSDLPAVSGARASNNPLGRTSRLPIESESKGSVKPPTADELRQRYGDLPLIIGGKRLSSIPAARALHPDDLPLVRPAQDTIDETGALPELQAEKLPAIQRPRAPAPANPESIAQAELPIVGANPRTVADSAAKVPSVSPTRKAPPRVAPPRAAQTTATRTGATDSPYTLEESDLVEEPKSQPPSTARTSVRPAMRVEPGEEAALPLPNLPPKEGASKQTTSSNQTASASNKPPIRANPTARPEELRNQENKLESTKAAESTNLRTAAATPARPQGGKLGDLAGLSASMGGNTRTLIGGVGASTIGGVAARDTLMHTDTSKSSPLVPALAPAPKLLKDSLISQVPSTHYGVAVPLLIDVTPLSLSVETVGTYCDVLIDRNTPVPCERSREFVTVHDGQQSVRVRVAQGESRLFSENVLLGELELTGLRPAPRGQLRISVTFGLDSDGLLHVRAIDLDTGRAAASELRLAGIPTSNEVAHMSNRQFVTS